MDTLGVCTSRNVRTVSLVVTVIDDFTGRPIRGSNARVWIENEKPPIKKDEGWFVFLNLPDGQHEINASGGVYNRAVCSCDIKAGAIVMQKMRLSPNSSYPIPADTTCIEGTAEPSAEICIYASDKASAFKLLSDVKTGADKIGIYHPDGFDAEGKLFKIISQDGKEEYIRTAQSVKDSKMEYQLQSKLKNAYAKIGTLIFPVYEATADEKGRFFIPIRNTYKGSASYVCSALGKSETSITAEIPSGRHTEIDLTKKKQSKEK